MIWLLVDSRTLGGIERHVAILSQALLRYGQRVQVVLLAKYDGNPWITQLTKAQIPFRELDGTIAGLWRAISDVRPDLIHTHGYKANIVGRGIAKLTHTPIVSTFHAGERGRFPVNLYQLVDEWTSFLGERVAVSAAIQKKLPFKSTQLKNFLLVSPKPPQEGFPKKIGFVGRLSFEKGPDRFCQLARRCKSYGEWHIFGDGPMRADLEAEFGGDVVFHGLITDLTEAYRSLGLVVMPSRAEGLPMAALEALEFGIPIAASAVGGLPTLITQDKNGWLFDGDNISEAEAAIECWARLGESEQHAMRIRCWSTVRDSYSERRELPAIIEVYRRAGLINQPAVPAI